MGCLLSVCYCSHWVKQSSRAVAWTHHLHTTPTSARLASSRSPSLSLSWACSNSQSPFRGARSGASLSHLRACTIMEENASLDSSDLETNPKLFGLDYSRVPNLKKDFSNFPEWAAAVNRYAEDNNLTNILNWTPESPQRPRSGEYSGVPVTSEITDTKHQLWYNNRVMDYYSWCHTRGAAAA
jgi:hypothetical protein